MSPAFGDDEGTVGTDAFGRPKDRGYGDGPVPPGARPAPGPAGPSGLPGMGPGDAPFVLASWWQRAVAAVVDGFVVLAIAVVLFVPLAATGVTVDTDAGAFALIAGFLVAAMVFAAAALVYQPLMLWRTDGRTVGKFATGIRVVKTDRTPMDITTAILREVVLKSVALAFLASFTAGIAYLVDWLWPLFDDERRALHDFPVNTRVVVA